MSAEVKLPKSAPTDRPPGEGLTQEKPAQNRAASTGPPRDGLAQDEATQGPSPRNGPEQCGAASTGPPPHNPIRIDADTCVKCDLCDWICPGDLIYKKPDDRETLPEVRYPDECWYCGLCQSICPVDAITIIFPKQMIQCRTDVTTLLGKVIE